MQLALPDEGPDESVEAWVDGKPTPVWNLKSMTLDSGKHTVALALDQTKQSEPFAIGQTGDLSGSSDRRLAGLRNQVEAERFDTILAAIELTSVPPIRPQMAMAKPSRVCGFRLQAANFSNWN